jgi:hypothetical protein
MNESKLPMDDVGGSNEPKSSNAPMEITLVCLCDMIQEVIKKCKQGVTLCDHINSFMKAKHMKHFLKNVNASLHLGMVLHHMEDGLDNYIPWMKNWHEKMVMHTNVCNKRSHK